ncbi:MAG: nicotinate-nucleotide adenylyltransferase [Proteobacteria bacterium]|nr:nicotinate-nucleotide adenylyltransferase [Pseudomonadota bacterium]
MTNPETGLAVFGGTFDPVHFGHLKSASAVMDLLGLSRVKFVPSFVPPHRINPSSTPGQRLSMLRIATCADDTMQVDDREVSRQGVSYTADTLVSFRSELGAAVPLYFILGIDSYCTLNEWDRWRDLTDVAHLVVLDRPGCSQEIPDEVLDWSRSRLVDDPKDIRHLPCGTICLVSLVQVEVTATEIREMLKIGTRPTGKMPEKVIDFALEHGLYC